MIRDKEKGSSSGIMANIIKDNGKMDKSTEMDYGNQKKGIAIQECGEMAKLMVSGYT